MKRLLFINLTLLLAAAVGGCASTGGDGDDAGSAATTIRLAAADVHLRSAARRALTGAGVRMEGGDALPLLQLSESYTSNVESLAADGSISGYEIDYQLHYHYDNMPPQTVRHVQVIDHDENRYRAGIVQQKEMVGSLRRSALAQMIIALQLR